MAAWGKVKEGYLRLTGMPRSAATASVVSWPLPSAMVTAAQERSVLFQARCNLERVSTGKERQFLFLYHHDIDKSGAALGPFQQKLSICPEPVLVDFRNCRTLCLLHKPHSAPSPFYVPAIPSFELIL